MAKIIQIRRDTAANWTSVDPTPAQGEPCLETDTGKNKMGDGVTSWTSLPYLDSLFLVDGMLNSPYESAAAAIADGIRMDDGYHNFESSALRKARPETLTLVCIGDSIPSTGGEQDDDEWGDSFINFFQRYSPYAFDLIAPSTRNSFLHAVGGTTSGQLILGREGVFQLDEILALSPAPSGCIIQIGVNDVKQSVNIETTIANVHFITDSLLAINIPVYLMSVVAGNTREEDLGSAYPAAIEAINNRYLLEFGNKRGVSFVDCRDAIEQSPGLIKSGGSNDGVHLTRSGHSILGRELARQMKWVKPERDVWAEGTIITEDPYFVTKNGVLIEATGATSSAVLSLRDDGEEETGERVIDIETSVQTTTHGSGDGAVLYTPVGGNPLYVWHLRTDALNIVVEGGTITVEVEYDGAVQNTANEVAAAILASPAASALVTAVAQGTGNDPTGATVYMDRVEFRPDYPTIDEPGLLNTDYVRALVEVRPTPGEDFDLTTCRLIMYSLNPFGIKAESGSKPSTSSEIFEPLDENGIITIITPWHLVGTARKFFPRFFAGYHCKFRLSSLYVQKKN